MFAKIKLRAYARQTLFVALLAIGVTACSTHQIPLPPPDIGQIAMEVRASQGQIRLSGSVGLAGGTITITDAIGNGIIRVIAGDGTFDTGFFDAKDGAHLDLSVSDSQRSSDPYCVVVSYTERKLTPCAP